MVIEPETPMTDAMMDLFLAANDGKRSAIRKVVDYQLFERWVDWNVNLQIRVQATRFAAGNIETEPERDAAIEQYEEAFRCLRLREFREATAAMMMKTVFAAQERGE